MKIFLCKIVLVCTFIVLKDINARPISYPGGWTLMQANDFSKHSFHLHYSPSIDYSIGYRAEYWREKEWQFHGLQLNYLIKRINKPKSQTNFYLKNGIGLATSNYEAFENKFEPSLFTGILFDWEDRRFFTSYQNQANYASSIDKFFSQQFRIGVAPYLAEYGYLHTWIMLQANHMPGSSKNLTFTPMLRVFKGDYLAEFGLNNYKDFMFNFIKRF